MNRLLIFLLLTLTSVASAQNDSLFLRVIIPDSDTVRTAAGRYRYAASTLPTARAFANGVETKVYPTGAFVGMFSPNADTSTFTLMAVGPRNDTLSRSFVFVRPERRRTSPHDTLVIEQVMMEPSHDRWLGEGDIVETRFKGSPGWDATFTIPGVVSGVRMRELPPREAGGLGGIYAGRYVVQHDDRAPGVQVEFRLKRSFWSREYASTSAKVWIMPDSLPRTAEVTARRAFLNVGLGTDRLGGAKLGYLQPGVLLSITGMEGRQYRVRLSESMEAWIPTDFVRLLPVETPVPTSLTGSISVSGSDTDDVVLLPLSRRLPYASDQRTDPNAVVVDVFGATSNTNWITQQLTAAGIAGVKWNQVAADQFRLTIALKHRQHWGYDIDYVGTSLRIRIRRPPSISDPQRPLAGMIVAVDAGHGGESNGALGATGVLEKDMTIAFVMQIDSILTARGARTVLTRRGDEGPSMADRTDRILESGARILVSVHCNSTGETSDPLQAFGLSTYYRYIGFKTLADTMFDRVLRTGVRQFGVVGSFNFSLSAPTQLPNVLVETAFLSNPDDEMLILDPEFRRQLALRVVEGLESFFLTWGEKPSPANSPVPQGSKTPGTR